MPKPPTNEKNKTEKGSSLDSDIPATRENLPIQASRASPQKSGVPRVWVIGVNHNSAAIEMRETLFIPEDELKRALPLIKHQFDFLELAALSTCNRFELIGLWSTKKSQDEQILYDAYLEIQKFSQAFSKYSHADLSKCLYLHKDHQAIRHIFRVASSLDSLVLGETQITGQFKDAIALASDVKTIGPTLGRLGQDALNVAKKVRSQTEIGEKHVSISHAAIDMAKKVFGDLSKHRFLLIGAGEMSRVAARHIMNYKPINLFVANRSLENAKSLVAELGFGEAFPLEELSNLLVKTDIVLSSTAASGLVIDVAMIKRAQAVRRGRPIFLLDIALPRDIDPDCGQLDDVYLFDIDDLKQVVGANFEKRRLAADEAQTIIDRSVSLFEGWLKTLSIKPSLKLFNQYLEDLFSRQAFKTLNRDIYKDLDEKQRQGLTALMTSLRGMIVGDVSKQIKRPPKGYYPEQLADALKELFSLADSDGDTQAEDEKEESISLDSQRPKDDGG